MDEAPLAFLDAEDGARLGYHLTEGASPTVVFLSGFASNMGGTKALHLERWCRERGQAFLRLDYQGHGQSSGEFEDGAIGLWAADGMFPSARSVADSSEGLAEERRLFYVAVTRAKD